MNLRNLNVPSLKEILKIFEIDKSVRLNMYSKIEAVGECSENLLEALSDDTCEETKYKALCRKEGIQLILKWIAAHNLARSTFEFAEKKVRELRDLITEMEGGSDK